jgi:hypothetical protein
VGDLARKGTSKTFRQLAEHVPLRIRNRVTELLDSVVFIQDPLLKDVRWLGVTTSDGEPTTSVASSDGLGLHIGGGTAYLTWRWKGVFYSQPFGQAASSGGSSTTVTEHSHDYAAVDHTHSIYAPLSHNHDERYYRKAEIITLLEGKSDVGHTHDHGNLTGLADDDHPAYLLASDATDRATFAADWLELTDGHDTTLHTHQHELLYGIGYYYHDEIDDHIDDATIHFTEDSIHHPEPVTVAVSPGPSVTLGDDVVVTGVAPVTPTHVDAVAELVFLTTGEIVMS